MFLLPFSAFFSDTYFTYLVHRAFSLQCTELFPTGTQSFGGQSLSSRPSRRRVEGSCIGFWKSKAKPTFCKVVKQKGEGKPTFSTRSFPLSLRPSPLPCGDQGSPPGPPMPCFVAQGFAFASGSSCFTNSRVQKLQKALLFAIVCRFFVAQSFAFAVFATLICQINSVFPCKDTKAQEFGLCRILGIVMPVFCGTELRFGIEKAISCATALCQNPRIRRSRILGIVCRFSPWYAFSPLIPAVWGFGEVKAL